MNIRNLLTVKSIVTLLLTITFVILSVTGFILGLAIPEYFVTVYTMIVSFYFGTQYQKQADVKEQLADKGSIEPIDI